MVNKLLLLLKENKTYTLEQLAKEMNVSIETAQSFLEFLTLKKIISQVDYQNIDREYLENCSNCKGCHGCLKFQEHENLPVIWQVKSSLIK